MHGRQAAGAWLNSGVRRLQGCPAQVILAILSWRADIW
jgi:hypothetical protein